MYHLNCQERHFWEIFEFSRQWLPGHACYNPFLQIMCLIVTFPFSPWPQCGTDCSSTVSLCMAHCLPYFTSFLSTHEADYETRIAWFSTTNMNVAPVRPQSSLLRVLFFLCLLFLTIGGWLLSCLSASACVRASACARASACDYWCADRRRCVCVCLSCPFLQCFCACDSSFVLHHWWSASVLRFCSRPSILSAQSSQRRYTAPCSTTGMTRGPCTFLLRNMAVCLLLRLRPVMSLPAQ